MQITGDLIADGLFASELVDAVAVGGIEQVGESKANDNFEPNGLPPGGPGACPDNSPSVDMERPAYRLLFPGHCGLSDILLRGVR
jgi:hypothetical protein